MPLLVGLLDTATVRRSLDGTLSVNGSANGAVLDTLEGMDLEELAAKRTAGGGLLESIANMANSILGAGGLYVPWIRAWLTSEHSRYHRYVFTVYTRSCALKVV
jgi:solute carrier family 38 (sodium-coupled neutral amino acid transporter), member 11